MPAISVDVVSPHRDDAALSLSQTLRRVVSAGGKFRILSCFTVTAWAPRITSAMSTEEVSDHRRREDEAFAQRFGMAADEVLAFDFVDGPLRPDWSLQGREIVQRTYGPDSDLVRQLSAALGARRGTESVWALPMAVGHRDHLACLWAGIASAADAPLLFYEDMPYALQVAPEDLAKQAAGLSERLGKTLSPIQVAAPFVPSDWVDDLSCYASQFSTGELVDIARRIAERGGERCWVDDRAMQLLGSSLNA